MWSKVRAGTDVFDATGMPSCASASSLDGREQEEKKKMNVKGRTASSARGAETEKKTLQTLRRAQS